MSQSTRKNKFTFYILISIILVVSVTDNLLTYIGSPDLSKEANPLVHTLGFSWTGLLIANVILFTLDVFMAYYVFIIYKPKAVKCKNRREYMSTMLFGRPDMFLQTLYKLPKGKDGYRFTFACLSFIFSILTPLIRLKATIEWSIYLLNPELFERYCDINGKVAVTTIWGRGDMIIEIIVLTILLMIVFVNRQFKANQEMINSNSK